MYSGYIYLSKLAKKKAPTCGAFLIFGWLFNLKDQMPQLLRLPRQRHRRL